MKECYLVIFGLDYVLLFLMQQSSKIWNGKTILNLVLLENWILKYNTLGEGLGLIWVNGIVYILEQEWEAQDGP